MPYLEKIGHLYIENQVNHKSASDLFVINKNQPSIQLDIDWSVFNLLLDKSYFVNVSIIRDDRKMVLNEKMLPVGSIKTEEPYLTMWLAYKPDILNPQPGSYELSVTLLDSDENICDYVLCYFEIQTKEKAQKLHLI